MFPLAGVVVEVFDKYKFAPGRGIIEIVQDRIYTQSQLQTF